MPPANSPTVRLHYSLETPPDTINTSPYLEQLAQLASPVPDFAATLITQAEQDANDDNVSFLRTPTRYVGSEQSGLTEGRRPSYVTESEFAHAQRESQRRMRRAVLHNRRYTPAQLQELSDSGDATTVEMPSRRQSGYHGWAPGSSDNEADIEGLTSARARLRSASEQLAASTARLNAEMNRAEIDQENTIRRRENGLGVGTGVLAGRSTGRLNDDWAQSSSHFVESGTGGEPTFTESSLRTTALLQSVRRHSRFSAHSRNQLESYMIERERSLRATSSRATPSSTQEIPAPVSPSAHQQLEQQRDVRHRDLQRQLHAMQRRHPDTTSTDPIEASWLEEAIKYLERLRSCDTYSDRISSAAEGGFIRGEFFAHHHEDFILDTTTIDPPPQSSWLKVGGVFSGSQHAAGGSSMAQYNVSNAFNRAPIAFESTADRPARRTTNQLPAQTSRGSWITSVANRISEGDERWPVKVTIHAIDYDSMTLSGTMEAFNVPDKSSPTHESSITTFLEGEIIDFNKFTLETKNFKATPKVDGTYWRKLEPFKKLTDNEIVKNLVSKKWIADELSKKWILMRWKEKCFITPSDAQSGLTISGFYYVSLRREDGHVEGLYYDPSSTPYQHLSLTPEKRMFPSVKFR